MGGGPQKKPGGSGILKNVPILHVSAMVDDLARTVSFYEEVFGYRVSLPPTDVGDFLVRMTGQDGIRARLVQMTHPTQPEVLEFISAEGHPDRAADALPSGHFAFSVPDLDAAVSEAVAAGAWTLGKTVTFSEGRSVYLREPGGSAFELEELFA